MAIDRRALIKSLAVGGTAVAAGVAPAMAAERKAAPPGAMGMLYDATLCIGCKTCVVACKQANDMPVESAANGGLWDAPTDLDSKTKNIIKLYRDGEQESFVKQQCMHCVDPGCAAACMLHSLHKDEVTGVVMYDPTYCVGCRYCMMACPFNVPKFEFEKAAPKIVKCELCRQRIKDAAVTGAGGFTRYPMGQGPACCEVCPREAVIYGRRDELLAEAKRRIAAWPGKYYKDRVYGEVDGGGTQVLYLAHVPFDKIGFPDLGTQPVPETAYAVQEGIYYKVPFLAPVGLFAVLGAVIYRNRRADSVGAAEKEDKR
ncbi:MAG: hydrogenase 2 operon protein HybA [Thermoanaerobaculaceae bacterium]|nr:hydrogenase 2 operon protein HybA [Thermoanaerobaculaceae bacterium]TAM49193.1 MAG: hydrogenase 2 operon protein HybA [Acidobacteriota bacterium]